MVAAPATTCARHRRRAKAASCGACGNGLCADCVVHTPVGIKCGNCSGVRPAARPRPAGTPGAPGPTGGARRPWVAAAVAAGVVVAAVAAYGLASGGRGPAREETPLGLAPATTERDSEFVGAGGLRIKGTLTLPGVRPGRTTVPAVLIIPGLGALDRDAATGAGAAGMGDMLRATLDAATTGNVQGPFDPLYRDLSRALADAGVASFRYERRGTGTSRLAPGQALSFDDEVADARAALDFLGARQEVGSSSLGVVGHDTGGLVAMRMAASHPRVRAAVLVSTPARPLGEVLADDLVRFGGGSLVDQVRASVTTVRTTGKAPAPEALAPGVRELFPAGQEGYLRALFDIDPLAEARAVRTPVLVVRGDADQSVPPADAQGLAAAVPGAAEVVAGEGTADHNLALPGEGHTHANTDQVVKPGDNRDSTLTGRLSTWVRSHLEG